MWAKVDLSIHGVICRNSFLPAQFQLFFPGRPSCLLPYTFCMSLHSFNSIHLFRTCIAPLERIKLECIVRGSKHSWIEIIKCIWVSEGLKGFWKGNMLNLFRMVPFKSINFICYDMYLDCLLRMPEKKEITNHDRLVSGGISGVTATILCLPLDTVSEEIDDQK